MEGAPLAQPALGPDPSPVSLHDALGDVETEPQAARPSWSDRARFAQAQFRSGGDKVLGSGRSEVGGTLSTKASILSGI